MEVVNNKWEIKVVVVINKMGGICSRTRRSSSIDNANVNNAPSGSYPHSNGHLGNGSYALPMKPDSNSMPSSAGNSMDMQLRDPFSFQEVNVVPYGIGLDDTNDGIPHLSRALSQKSRSTKSKQVAVAKVILTWCASVFYSMSLLLLVYLKFYGSKKSENIIFYASVTLGHSFVSFDVVMRKWNKSGW